MSKIALYWYIPSVSMIDASNGQSIWDQSIKGYPAAQNANWNRNGVYFFAGDKHFSASSDKGEIHKNSSLFEKVTVTRWNGKKYETKKEQTLKKSKKPITYFSNLLVGDYHYFRSFSGFMIGRVNLKNGKAEYLEVPAHEKRIRFSGDHG